ALPDSARGARARRPLWPGLSRLLPAHVALAFDSRRWPARRATAVSSDKRWHRLDLGDALLAESEVAEIQEQAEAEFERLGRPPGWAVYLVHTSGDLHCSALLFFSPAAAELAG